MYPTAEVRWFFRGPVPAGTEAWFGHRRGSLEQEPPRTDRYLVLPGSRDLNVKLREGRVEIKQRLEQGSMALFHKRVTGIVERWRKWSFEIVESDSTPVHVGSGTSSWIPVQKERRLRTYQVKEERDVVARSTPEPPAHGCELELARIRAARETWWTLAFEAFGDEPTLQENLLLVAQHVFDVEEPPSLPASNSRGYAAWLVTVAKKGTER